MIRDDATSDARKNSLSAADLEKGIEILESFQREKQANQRIAKIGFVSLFLIAVSLVVYFELTSGPDKYVSAKIVNLNRVADRRDPRQKSYIALVKLSTGENVLAKVDVSLFSRLSPTEPVRVGYYEDEEKYEVLEKIKIAP